MRARPKDSTASSNANRCIDSSPAPSLHQYTAALCFAECCGPAVVVRQFDGRRTTFVLEVMGDSTVEPESSARRQSLVQGLTYGACENRNRSCLLLPRGARPGRFRSCRRLGLRRSRLPLSQLRPRTRDPRPQHTRVSRTHRLRDGPAVGEVRHGCLREFRGPKPTPCSSRRRRVGSTPRTPPGFVKPRR